MLSGIPKFCKVEYSASWDTYGEEKELNQWAFATALGLNRQRAEGAPNCHSCCFKQFMLGLEYPATFPSAYSVGAKMELVW